MSSICQRFMFEEQDILGVIVKIKPAVQAVLQCHHYPNFIANELASTLMSSVLLNARFKERGELILQLHDGGSISLLVAKCGADLTIRGLAQYDMAQDEAQLASDFSLGRLSVTYFKDESDKPIQSVVDLSSSSVDKALERYFLQSEQVPTMIRLDQERGVGVLLQRMPSEREPDNVLWGELRDQLDSVEPELNDLDVKSLLRVSFPEHDIRLFEETTVDFKCPCSQQKMFDAIATLPVAEVQTMIEEDGGIDMTCEYCLHQYHFGEKDVRSILAQL